MTFMSSDRVYLALFQPKGKRKKFGTIFEKILFLYFF